MRIFIDTNSDWNGGYLSHLKGFLSSIAVQNSKNEYIVYGPSKLQRLLKPFHENVNFITDDSLPLGFYKMNLWRKHKLPTILKKYHSDVHYNPMGWLASKHNICPQVTMSRNLQPFISTEINRLSFFAKEKWRLMMSKRAMLKSYNRADGLIFLSDYAREIISPSIKNEIETSVISHGVNEHFRNRNNFRKNTLNKNEKIKILYVSRVFTYKNHDKVILAIDLLRKKLNLDIQLILIGGVSTTASYLIDSALNKLEDTEWIQFKDAIPNHELINWYHSSDIFVFASSVENFPNILLEAMASGLPIACSNRRPMKDILLDGGVYFEPEQPESISDSIEKMIFDDNYRHILATNAYNKSQNYSYERMSNETLNFIEKFAQ